MGANSYSCGNSFGAINHRLWLKIALIWLFFIIILTFFIVTTTVILTLGISCTQRAVTHVYWVVMLNHLDHLQAPI